MSNPKRVGSISIPVVAVAVAVAACGEPSTSPAFYDGPTAQPTTDAVSNDSSSTPFCVAVDDAYTVADTGLTTVGAALGVLANDPCAFPTVVATLEEPPEHGTLQLLATGGFGYTVAPGNQWCSDRFTYGVGGGVGDTGLVRLSLFPAASRCRRADWRAYSREPYVYMGCPDPGPAPWTDVPTFAIDGASASLEVDLASAVPLGVTVVAAPSNGRVLTSSYGFAFVPNTTAATRDRVTLRVTSGTCQYDVTAELVTGSP